MRAIVLEGYGGPEKLVLRDVPEPTPARGEVRVRVRAAAVNRADLLQRMGQYPPPPDAPQDIPGIEFAGEVDALGDGVAGLSVGDRVMGLVGGGAYAEKVVIHARAAARIPGDLSFVDAAAVPEAFLTAYDAMVSQAGLSAGEVLLVHAVGSGVGSAAVQLAKAIGATVVGTARTEAKLERARALGMDHGILVNGGKFAETVLGLTDGRGANVVLELVGGAYVAEDIACAAPLGRIAVVGLMAGARFDADLGALMRKRLTVRGTVLRGRPLEEKLAAAQVFARHVVPLLAAGEIEPVVDRVIPLAQAGEAHRYVASNQGFGKVILEVA